MKKVLLIIVMLFLSSTLVMAQQEELIRQQLSQSLAQVKGAELPTPVAVLFGDERANIQITLDTGMPLELYVVSKEGIVQDIDIGQLDDPTIVIKTSQQAVQKIGIAKDPLEEFQKARKDGRVSIEAVTFGGKLKIGFLGVVAKVVSWFR